jgi:hypothetical protein
MVEIRTHTDKTATHEIINLQITDCDLSFEEVCDQARYRARQINKDAMMLAWYNRRSGEGFPDYDCGANDKPPWQVFAEARGANLTIDVNNGEFIFLYLTF